MKHTKIVYRIALALTCCLAATLKAQEIYIANQGSGNIGEYGLNGSAVNASLISGLLISGYEGPSGIAISGNNLFVVNNDGTIGEYTTSGETVNASLISGLDVPGGIAISTVPEPSFVVLSGLGAAALWLWRRRK